VSRRLRSARAVEDPREGARVFKEKIYSRRLRVVGIQF
jgi:hypothetical protein